MKGTMTVRGLLGVLAVLMLSLTFAAGCNLLASDQDQALEEQKQKNEKLQKQLDEQQKEAARRKAKEEEARQKELEQQVNDLQKKVDSQDKKDSQDEKSPEENASQPTESRQPEQPQPQQADEQARAAAVAYYQAAAARNWGYTYDHLDSETQSAYTEQEWFAKNEYLADTGAVTYTIQSVVMDSSAPETFAYVTVVLTATDGSTNVRNTYWVYEAGSWLHRFSAEEYDLLASAPTGSSSASPSASASASGTSAQGNPYGCPDDRPIPATRAGDPGEGSLRCFATRSEANAYHQGN
jgi:hypothetical protein